MAKLDIEIPPPGWGHKPELFWRQWLALADGLGIPRNQMLMAVIMDHLTKGDPEPFLATATEQRDNLPRSHLWGLLDLIANMLLRDPDLPYRLELVPNGNGRPPKAGIDIRDILMTAMYAQLLRDGINPNGRLGLSSDDAYTAVAKHFGTGIETVRRAVKKVDKMEKAQAKGASS
jgi:hypothetical protein